MLGGIISIVPTYSKRSNHAKSKVFAVERSYEGRRDEEICDRLLPDISDWTEITQAQLNNLRIHRDSIEDALCTDKTLDYGERLLFVVDLPAEVAKSVVINISQIVDSVAKKQKVTSRGNILEVV